MKNEGEYRNPKHRSKHMEKQERSDFQRYMRDSLEYQRGTFIAAATSAILLGGIFLMAFLQG